MTNQEYEKIYDTALEIERGIIFEDFRKAWSDNEKGFSPTNKINYFQDYLTNNKKNLIWEQLAPDHYLPDSYCLALVRRFQSEKPNYIEDQYYIKFFEVIVPEIRRTYKPHDFGVWKERYNASNEQTLKYIAKYYAHAELLDAFPDNDEKYEEVEELINVLGACVTKSKAKIINTFCNSMPLNIPKEHFKVFTISNSKNKNSPFLSIEQFNSFIEKAFTGKTELPKQTFNLAPHKEKLYIIKRFYEFYLIAVKDFEKTSQCKEKYIKLLSDNFINWDYEQIKNNFGNKVKRDW